MSLVVKFVTFPFCFVGSSTGVSQHLIKHLTVTAICVHIIQFGNRLTLSWNALGMCELEQRVSVVMSCQEFCLK